MLSKYCGKGHLYDEANTYNDNRGKRNCRKCRNLVARKFYAKYLANPLKPYNERLNSLIEKSDGCWLWRGTVNEDGYGKYGKWSVHRYIYQRDKGKLLKGYEIDHLCRVRNCVNPDHLEQVTHLENLRRGDYKGYWWLKEMALKKKQRKRCKNGHKFTKGNTVVESKDGKFLARRCRECERAKFKRYALKVKGIGRNNQLSN